MNDTAPRDAVARLLRPRSVAIIGASSTPGSLGGSVLATLDRFGFTGDIHLINPNRAEIGGRPCLKDADALPFGVDCAVLAIPRAGAVAAIAACARRGVGGAILFSAGFAETGEEGRAAQAEITRIAREAGMAVEGPNCLGMTNYVDSVALTFSATAPMKVGPEGGLAIVSQSGAMATVVSSALRARDVPLSFAISTGNEAVCGVEDFLAHVLEDPATRAVAMVAEQFGAPQRFLELARRARALGKPIVLLHPGSSEAARASAETHTGKLAGNHAAMSTIVAHEGVLLAHSLEELIDLSEFLLRCPALPHGGVAVITDSGAFKALSLDYCETVSLALPQPGVSDAPLREVLPVFVPPSNPLDLTAQALVDPDLYRKTLIPILADPAYGSVLLAVIITNGPIVRIKLEAVIEAIRVAKPTKPVILGMLGEDVDVPPDLIAGFRALGVPFFRSPERALRALARLTPFADRPAPAPSAPPRSAPKLPRGVMAEHEAKPMLAEWGISVPPGAFVRELAAAQAVAARIGYPVALKAQSSALSHKSDAGGVVLRLGDAAALADGWARLHAGVAAARPGLVLDGVLVEAMAAPGVELIVGARRDPHWGPVLLVGLGGVVAEALGDVRLIPADLPAPEIIAELLKLRGAALLRGFRGAPPCDLPAVAALVSRLGELMRAAPQITEVDLNPVMVRADGAVALDAVMVVEG